MFTRYPGKLFLMGEFAIMEKGSVAVVSAVNHYLNITIEPSDTFEIISSYGKLRGQEVFENKVMPHIHTCLQVLEDLFVFKPFKLEIQSELEIDGVKVGFGSSGVVIVGVLDSLLRFHEVSISKLELFKLACIVQLKMDEFSSGGDLASCVYRDTVVYHTYDREWLMDQDLNTKKLLTQVWPDLKIEPLSIDRLFDLEIGWTGEPNSTNVSLQVLNQRIAEDPEYYLEWVKKANKETLTFIEAVTNESFDVLSEAVFAYQQLMSELQEWLGIAIETPQLKALMESTQYPSKISGSGGGDCGIVFVPKGQSHDFIQTWKNENIKQIKGGTHHEY